MLLDKIYGSETMSARDLGIEDARIMEVDNVRGTVKIDIEYLEGLEEKLSRISRENIKLKEDNGRLIDEANSIIYKLEGEKRKLSNELQEVKEKTNYIDLDYEALKVVAIEAGLTALNLESELSHLKDKTVKVKYTKEYVEKELNKRISGAKDMLKDVSTEKYIDTLQKVGLMEKEIRRLEIDNKILVEKVGGEVKHSERIKMGYDNVRKSEVTKEVIEELIGKGLSKVAIAERLKVTRQTIYNILNS